MRNIAQYAILRLTSPAKMLMLDDNLTTSEVMSIYLAVFEIHPWNGDAVPARNAANRVIGTYTLSILSIGLNKLSDEHAGELPRHPSQPTAFNSASFFVIFRFVI